MLKKSVSAICSLIARWLAPARWPPCCPGSNETVARRTQVANRWKREESPFQTSTVHETLILCDSIIVCYNEGFRQRLFSVLFAGGDLSKIGILCSAWRQWVWRLNSSQDMLLCLCLYVLVSHSGVHFELIAAQTSRLPRSQATSCCSEGSAAEGEGSAADLLRSFASIYLDAMNILQQVSLKTAGKLLNLKENCMFVWRKMWRMFLLNAVFFALRKNGLWMTLVTCSEISREIYGLKVYVYLPWNQRITVNIELLFRRKSQKLRIQNIQKTLQNRQTQPLWISRPWNPFSNAIYRISTIEMMMMMIMMMMMLLRMMMKMMMKMMTMMLLMMMMKMMKMMMKKKMMMMMMMMMMPMMWRKVRDMSCVIFDSTDSVSTTLKTLKPANGTICPCSCQRNRGASILCMLIMWSYYVLEYIVYAYFLIILCVARD